MVDPFLALSVAVIMIVGGALLFWPDHGLIPRWRNTRRLTRRVLSEDALKHIHKWEMRGQQPTLESVAGALHISMNTTVELLNQMHADGLVDTKGGDIQLTPKGREAALHIIRAHRLWERYLAEETGFDEASWHEQAERFEHELSPEAADELYAQLNFPTHDPHGDPIPSGADGLVEHRGLPLTKIATDSQARIVHLEDEPDIVYAQLVAEGLHPGQVLHVIESNTQRIRFWTNGDEHVLAPMVAVNIAVTPLTRIDEEIIEETRGCVRLNCLDLGETAVVIGISQACRGAERRRFLDLGIIPGTTITAELRSAGGEPTAYRIRGALIALRPEQARHIKVKREQLQPDAVTILEQ